MRELSTRHDPITGRGDAVHHSDFILTLHHLQHILLVMRLLRRRALVDLQLSWMVCGHHGIRSMLADRFAVALWRIDQGQLVGGLRHSKRVAEGVLEPD